VVLEWCSFALIAPAILGRTPLKQLAEVCRRVARMLLVVGNPVAAFGRPTPGPFEIEKFGDEIQRAVVSVRAMWRQEQFGKSIIIATLIPTAVCVGLAVEILFLLRGPFRLWAAVPLAIGPCCALVAKDNPSIAAIARQGFDLSRLSLAACGVVFWFAVSTGVWIGFPLAAASYGLLRLSEERWLRAALFGLGAFTFAVAKAVEFLRP